MTPASTNTPQPAVTLRPTVYCPTLQVAICVQRWQAGEARR